MVGGICCVWIVPLSVCEVAIGKRGSVRKKISALALSFSTSSTSSSVPYTRRILGYTAATWAPLSEVRTIAVYSYSGWAFSSAYRASPPIACHSSAVADVSKAREETLKILHEYFRCHVCEICYFERVMLWGYQQLKLEWGCLRGRFDEAGIAGQWRAWRSFVGCRRLLSVCHERGKPAIDSIDQGLFLFLTYNH